MAAPIAARRSMLWQLLSESVFCNKHYNHDATRCRPVLIGDYSNSVSNTLRSYWNKTALIERCQFQEAPWIWRHALKCEQQRQFSVSREQQPPGTYRECWNCKKSTERRSHIFCSSCRHLQPVDTQIKYFELLNIPHSFAVEPQLLTQRFRQLQVLVHPDKFSNKTLREQTYSADWSSLINKAYKTLSSPIERGQYMLQLNGQKLTQDNSALDKEFLMAMMERNEDVERAVSRNDLMQLNAEISLEIEEKVEALQEQFARNALEQVKATLVEMKYLLSIQNSIKRKQEEFLERA